MKLGDSRKSDAEPRTNKSFLPNASPTTWKGPEGRREKQRKVVEVDAVHTRPRSRANEETGLRKKRESLKHRGSFAKDTARKRQEYVREGIKDATRCFTVSRLAVKRYPQSDATKNIKPSHQRWQEPLTSLECRARSSTKDTAQRRVGGSEGPRSQDASIPREVLNEVMERTTRKFPNEMTRT